MPDNLDDRLDAALDEHREAVVEHNHRVFGEMLRQFAKDSYPLTNLVKVQPMSGGDTVIPITFIRSELLRPIRSD